MKERETPGTGSFRSSSASGFPLHFLFWPNEDSLLTQNWSKLEELRMRCDTVTPPSLRDLLSGYKDVGN